LAWYDEYVETGIRSGSTLNLQVVNWSRKIPRDLIDLDRKAISAADKYLMWGGLLFLTVSKICYLGQLVVPLLNVPQNQTLFELNNTPFTFDKPNNEPTLAANILQILYKLSTIVCLLRLKNLLVMLFYYSGLSDSVHNCCLQNYNTYIGTPKKIQRSFATSLNLRHFL
jgi:hypothetical protein